VPTLKTGAAVAPADNETVAAKTMALITIAFAFMLSLE
jgi:hypothetical protein